MTTRKIALLFAGQGTQYVGMGRDFYEESPVARAIFDIGEAFRPGTPEMCFSGSSAALSRPENLQPCLYLCDLAIAGRLADAGLRPDAVAGFSIGELAALAFAGVITDADGFRLATLRGSEMAGCALRYPCTLTAVLGLDAPQVCALAAEFTDIYPISFECPGQVSVAGFQTELPSFCAKVMAAGGRAIPLTVGGAQHTPYMSLACASLTGALSCMTVSKARMPVYANLTGLPYPGNPAQVKDTIADEVMSCVRFEESIRRMAESGIDTFIEIGPGDTLSGYVSRTVPGADVFRISTLDEMHEVLGAIGI